MSAMTYYLSNKLLDHTVRHTSYISPYNVYLALFTSATDVLGAGTEVTGGSYARQEIFFSAAANGSLSNTTDIFFPTATAIWGSVTHFGVFDSISRGTMLFFGKFDTATYMNVGNVRIIDAGTLIISLI